MAQFTPETIIRIADNMFYLLLVIIITEQIKNIVKNFNKKNDDTSQHP